MYNDICSRCGSMGNDYQWAEDRNGNSHVRQLCASCGRYKAYVPRTQYYISKINVREVYRIPGTMPEPETKPAQDDLFDDNGQARAHSRTVSSVSSVEPLAGTSRDITDDGDSPDWGILGRSQSEWLARYPYLADYPPKTRRRKMIKIQAHETLCDKWMEVMRQICGDGDRWSPEPTA